MENKKFVFENGFAVNTTKCVYVDGTNLTLDSYLKQLDITKKYVNEFNISMEEHTLENARTLHSMFVKDDKLITLEVKSLGGECAIYSLPSLQYEGSFFCNFVDTNLDQSTYELRLVCCDYNKNGLIVGNSVGSGQSEDRMKGFIFYGVDEWLNSSEEINFGNCGAYTTLDFANSSLFDGITSGAKIVWSELEDVIYLTTNLMNNVYKILLGKNTNKFENGVYDVDTSKKYNGTFKVLNSYKNNGIPYSEGNKDTVYLDGAFFSPIKHTGGGIRIVKTYLLENGGMQRDLYIYNPVNQINGSSTITGSPEGCVAYNNKLILGHANFAKTLFIKDI